MPGAVRRDALIVLLSFLVLGVLCGVLWSLVVTPAEFTKLAQGGAMGEQELAKRFGADGWFVTIGAASSLLVGLALCRWRSRDPLLTSVLVVIGSLVAAVVTAAVGHLLGPGDAQAALDAAQVGAKVPEQLDVGVVPLRPLTDYLRGTVTLYAAWPIGALAGALVVLLGRPVGAPDYQSAEHQPG
jgi:hypothetical protein